jgi:small basic protein
MLSDIQQLELASGIKDSLINAGFSTIESILNSSIADLSNKVGVDLYIAQIILNEARKFGTGTDEQQVQLLISDRELMELN